VTTPEVIDGFASKGEDRAMGYDHSFREYRTFTGADVNGGIWSTPASNPGR